MNVNLEYYRIFFYVAKYGSFTKAAEVLGGNQPNVTRCMNALENALGCKLLLRSHRGVSLTPEGERLYVRVQAALEQLQRGESELAAATGLQSGSVTIGASETALNLFLLEQLSIFHRRFPGIRLRIFNHSTPQAIAALRQGSVDLAVVTTPVAAGKDLHATKLMAFREILVGAGDYAALADKPLPFQALADYPLIMLGRETMTYAFYERLFLQHGLVLHPDTEAATADQLLPLAKGGLGLCFLPEAIARPAMEAGDVTQIPLSFQIPPRSVVLLTDKHSVLSAAGRELEKQLSAAAENSGPPAAVATEMTRIDSGSLF